MGTQSQAPATEAQTNLLAKLADERAFHPSSYGDLKRRLAARDLSKQSASSWISYALGLPKVKAAPAPAAPAANVPTWADANAAVAELDTAFYAIPASYLVGQEIDLYGNTHLFLRVRKYSGRTRMSRVSGSVGGFAYRAAGSPRTQVALANLIKGRELEFQRAFHELTGRCGRCAADLTDVRSRETGFGPECRKVRGI